MHIYFDHQYNDTAHSFDTLRKATALALDLTARPIDGVELVSPAVAAYEELLDAHDGDYLDAIVCGVPSSLAESQGFAWDEGLPNAVFASTGGVRDAARRALELREHSGSLSSGLHHARRDIGAGFCTINGLAVAALDAVQRGAQRVLILDLDAHCGGGTASIIDGHPGIEQVDVSVSRYDEYRSRPTARLSFASGANYLDVVERELEAITDPSTIDLVLYNAGVDPHEWAGGVSGITHDTIEAREAMVFDWADTNRLPVAWVLAGGYTGGSLDQDGLVALHRMVAEAAAHRSIGV